MTLRKTMTSQGKWPVAIIGLGNIGTDLTGDGAAD